MRPLPPSSILNQEDNPELPAPRPVIRWPGGKQRLLKFLLPLIPEHTLYCEVFGGGLALLLAKRPSPVEVLNDIHRDLVSFYRCVKYHREALLDELDLVLNSRRDFEDYGGQPGLTEIQRAARWFIRNRLSFGGQGMNFAICRASPMASRTQRLIAIMSLNRRLDRVIIEERPWEKILTAYDSPESFFFVDPPYLADGGAAYSGWSEHELERFCTALRGLRGKWLFTFQDCREVRTLMVGYRMKVASRQNALRNQGADRIGQRYHELIFTSERTAAARKAA
jgi:DNA adenine methylase